jgi:hypothetical protein
MTTVNTVPATPLFAKYAAALLPAIFTLLGVLQVVLADEKFDDTEKGQFLFVVAGVIATYFVPLLSGKWAGALKTGAAILAAVATLLVPLFSGDWNTNTLIVIGLAALNALATEIGVDIRKDAAVPPNRTVPPAVNGGR